MGGKLAQSFLFPSLIFKDLISCENTCNTELKSEKSGLGWYRAVVRELHYSAQTSYWVTASLWTPQWSSSLLWLPLWGASQQLPVLAGASSIFSLAWLGSNPEIIACVGRINFYQLPSSQPSWHLRRTTSAARKAKKGIACHTQLFFSLAWVICKLR